MPKKINKIENQKGAFFIPILIGIAVVSALAGGGAAIASKLKSNFLGSIIIGVAEIIYNIGKGLAYFSSMLFNQVLVSDWMNKPITSNATFVLGWTEVRDLANMFLVLGLVVIGIATALRIQEYAAKKLLGRLILIALVINFSGIFCGLIIDASNIIMHTFLQGGNGIGTSIYDNIVGQANSGAVDWGGLVDNSQYSEYLYMCVEYAVLYIMLAIVMFYLAITLIARYAVLAILYILSPIAFAFWIFPNRLKKYQSEWWDNFIKWAFIGVFGSFFIFIAAQMMEKMKDPKDLDLIVVMVFLYVGLKITKKSSAMGAAAVMGLAGKALGYAGVGAGIAGMGGSKVLDKLTGNRASEAAQKVKSGAGRAMERLGLRNTGTTASANNKKVSEKASLMEKEYTAAKATGDTATIERIQKQAKVGRGVDGAAAYKVVSDAKDIHKAFADPTAKGGVNLEAAAQRAKYAEATGATGIIKDSEKAMPGIAGHNEISINGIVDEWAGKKDSKTGIRTGGKLNPANGLPWTEADAKAAAPREAIRRRNAGMTMQEMRGMPAPQMDANHIEDSNVGTFRRAALEYDTDHKDKALALLEERGEGSIRDKRNIAYGADPTVHTTAAARQTHYDANLSGEALVNKHNSMTAAQINTWATTLTPAQEQEYVNANGQAESAKIYKQIEIAKNAAATATHGGNMKKGDDLSNKMNIIAELKD